MMSQGQFPNGFQATTLGDTIISPDGRKLKLIEDADQRSVMQNSVKIREFISEASEGSTGTTTGATSFGGGGTGTPKEEIPTEWKAIKSKEAKNHLVALFASEIARTNDLTPLEGKKIAEQINLCIQLKIFESPNIHLDEGKIEEIEGLEFDDDGKVVIPHIKVSKKSASTKKKKNVLRIQIDKMMKDNSARIDDLFFLSEE